jgi:hypothetical protein
MESSAIALDNKSLLKVIFSPPNIRKSLQVRSYGPYADTSGPGFFT